MNFSKKDHKYYFNILALDRSRSTISDIVISRKTAATSLGEVARVVSPLGNEKLFFAHEVKCTCGSQISKCEFWAKIFSSEDRVKSYFNSYISSKNSLCDSSKTIRHSQIVRRNIPDNELVGILILRDFTEWSRSVKRAIEAKSEGRFVQIFKDQKFWKASLRLAMRRFYICRVLEYIITNLRLAKELSNYSNRIIICGSQDFDEFDSFTNNSKNNSMFEKHIIRGNRIMLTGKEMDFWELKNPISKSLARVIKIALKKDSKENQI